MAHRAKRLHYNAKVADLERHRADLYEHTSQSGLSDYEAGKRRDRIRELTAKIAEFEQPELINTELYEVRKQMLKHKLREIAHLNATLLIG